MLHVGLDLSRRRLDVCVLSDDGELVEELAAPPDAEGLRYLVSKLARDREPVRAVIESMTGARFVHHMEGVLSSGRVDGAVWRWCWGWVWWRLVGRSGRCRVSRLWSASYAGAGYPKTFCSSHGPLSNVELSQPWVGCSHAHRGRCCARGREARAASPAATVVRLVRLWWSASAGWGVSV